MDTGAVVALADRTDPYHKQALDCAEAIAAAGLPLFLALPTIIEAHRKVMFRFDRSRARLLLNGLYDGSLNQIDLTATDERAAMDLLDRFHWLDLTLADALNMTAMLRTGIRAVFSFDDDFTRAGFIRVPEFYAWW